MTRLIALAALPAAMAATLAAGASAPPPVPPEASAVTDTKSYDPEAVNSFPIGRLARKMAYATDSKRQIGELRMPSGPGPYPLAVIWHGGCWAGMGGTANVAELARFLQRNGVAVLTLSYRELGSGGGWPATFADWAQGLALVDYLDGGYEFDPGRVTLIGHSAGVTPAMWLAMQDKGEPAAGTRLPKVRAVVALDGPLSLGPFVGPDAMVCGQPVVAPLMGGTPAEVPERYALVDPLVNKLRIKRMLVVDGALPDPDPTVIEGLRAQGIKVDVIEVDQDEHFNMLVPGTRDFAAIAPALLDIVRGR
jgi:acetyl esterase/lipase